MTLSKPPERSSQVVKINFTTDDGEEQAKNELQTGFVGNFRGALERELELVNDTRMTEIMGAWRAMAH